MPDNFIPELVAAKDAVQQLPQVAVGGVVAVQIQAAAGLEDPVNFDKPPGHKAQISRDVLTVQVAGVVNQPGHRRVGIRDVLHPILMNVLLPGPDVAVAAG